MAGGNKQSIDWGIVDNHLQQRMSGKHIAEIIGVHFNTLYKRCKAERGITFVTLKQEKREQGIERIISKQFEEGVDKGNISMLIWLGKQYAGQTDKSDHTTGGDKIQPLNVNVVRDENVDKYKKHLEKLAKLN